MAARASLPLALAIGLCACATQEGIRKKAFRLTPEHFQSRVDVRTDPRTTVVEFSSRRGFRVRRGVRQRVLEDHWLRGFINKTTGRRGYQVYCLVSYTDTEWRDYRMVGYETAKGQASKELTQLEREAECPKTGPRGPCRYIERAAFVIDEMPLRSIAGRYSPESEKAWTFQLIPKRGKKIRRALLPAEAAGFLRFMDRYSKDVLGIVPR